MKSLSTGLQEILHTDAVEFDDRMCFRYSSDEGLACDFRFHPEPSILIAAAPVGRLDVGHREVAALVLLSANCCRELTAGGAIGLRPESGALVLSRCWYVDEHNIETSLAGLDYFLSVSRVLKGWLRQVEWCSIESDEPGPEIEPIVESLQHLNEQVRISHGPLLSGETREATEKFADAVGSACSSLGIALQHPDESRSVYLSVEGEFAIQVRHEPLCNEIVLSTVLGRVEDAQSAVIEELLCSNLFLQQTGFNVIGLEPETGGVVLSFSVPLDLLQSDPSRLPNLLGSFANVATGWRQEFAELKRSSESSTDASEVHSYGLRV